MGGVAVLVHKSIDHGAVKVEVGEGENEYLAVKLECFQPALVVFAMYGQQENQHKTEDIKNNLAEVLAKAQECSNRGEEVLFCGDLNVKVGNTKSGLVGNDAAESPGGKFLMEAVEETDLELLNTLHTRGDGRTHVDATAGSSRILDLAFSNINADKIKFFDIDEERNHTPYRIKLKAGKAGKEREVSKVFTDHKSIRMTLKLDTNHAVKQSQKLTTWRYGAPGGRDRYFERTDEEFDEMVKIITEEPDIEQVMEKLNNKMILIKDEVYKRSTKTVAKVKKIEDDKVWAKRIEILRNSINEMEGEKVTDKIYKTRTKSYFSMSERACILSSTVSP